MLFGENIRLLLKLYYRPLAAMSGLMDQGHWLFAGVLAVVVSAMVQFALDSRLYRTYEAAPVAAHRMESTANSRVEGGTKTQAQSGSESGVKPAPGSDDDSDNDDDYEVDYRDTAPATQRARLPLIGDIGLRFVSFASSSIFGDVLGLAVLYVPACILLMTLLGQSGSFGVIFRRDYVSLLICSLMAWSAAHIPVVIAGLALSTFKISVVGALGAWLAGKAYFAVLMVCALRTVFGAGYGRSIVTVSFAWLPMLAEPFLMSTRLMYYMASPFLLFYGYRYFRGELGDLGFAVSQRQGYRRYLESAMINPHDAEAHYQLGMIYHQRHQYAEAIERFKKAIEIDPRETDAHYQLGVIARLQGRMQEAIDCFNTVVSQDDRHSMSEVWREIGATYLAVGMLEEARDALDRFVERRPYDAQGLYLLGDCLQKLGRGDEANEMYRRCVEASKTTPYYRRGETRKWRRLAERQARAMRSGTRTTTA